MSRMGANLKANDARIMALCGRLYHKVGKLLQKDIGGKMDYLMEAELTNWTTLLSTRNVGAAMRARWSTEPTSATPNSDE